MRMKLRWLDVLGDYLPFLRPLPNGSNFLENQWDFN